MWNPFKRKWKIISVEDRVPSSPAHTYVIQFDFLNYPIELHYLKTTPIRGIREDIANVYKQVKNELGK